MRIPASANAGHSAMLCTPGSPNATSTPASPSARAIASAPFTARSRHEHASEIHRMGGKLTQVRGAGGSCDRLAVVDLGLLEPAAVVDVDRLGLRELLESAGAGLAVAVA